MEKRNWLFRAVSTFTMYVLDELNVSKAPGVPWYEHPVQLEPIVMISVPRPLGGTGGDVQEPLEYWFPLLSLKEYAIKDHENEKLFFRTKVILVAEFK